MAGYNFRLDAMSGRFFPVPNEGSLGDGTVVVTDAPDSQLASYALNRAAAVPVNDGSKWTVTYTALTNAIAGGTRAVLSAA